MKNAKKLTAVLMAVLMASVTFIGCGGKKAPDTAETGSTDDGSSLSGQTVSMVIWGADSRKSAYDELFKDFTAETGINVEITLVALEEIVTKTSAQIAANDSYDMVWMSEAMIPQFMATDNLEDISAIMDDKDYNFTDLSQSVVENYVKDGKLYAVPFTSSPRVWFYNKNLIEKANLEDPIELAAKGEWTYDKLIEYSKAISKLGDSTYGFSIWNYQSPNDWNILLDWTYAQGASFFDKDMTTCTINTEEGITALDSYKACIKDGLTPTPDSSIDFASGQIGFTRNTISLKGTLTDVDFEWDILPNPTGSDKEAPVAVGVAAYVIPKGTSHKKAAMEAIKYITSEKLMASDFLMSNFSPIRASVLSGEKFLNQGTAPSAKALKLAILDPMSGNTRLYPTCYYYDEADLKVKEILSNWYADNYTDTAAMTADMETKLNAILQQ